MTPEAIIAAVVGGIIMGIGGKAGVDRLRNGNGARSSGRATPVPVTVVAEAEQRPPMNPRLTESGRWDIPPCAQHEHMVETLQKLSDGQAEIRANVRVLIGEFRADREDRREDRRERQDLAERIARIGG